MDYQIRLSTMDDLPAIVDIFNQAIPLQVNDESAPIEVADRREWFLQFDSTHPIWVATMDGQVIAWCALEYFYPHPAYDHSAQIAIYIREDYRRQHLGRDLLTFSRVVFVPVHDETFTTPSILLLGTNPQYRPSLETLR